MTSDVKKIVTFDPFIHYYSDTVHGIKLNPTASCENPVDVEVDETQFADPAAAAMAKSEYSIWRQIPFVLERKWAETFSTHSIITRRKIALKRRARVPFAYPATPLGRQKTAMDKLSVNTRVEMKNYFAESTDPKRACELLAGKILNDLKQGPYPFYPSEFHNLLPVSTAKQPLTANQRVVQVITNFTTFERGERYKAAHLAGIAKADAPLNTAAKAKK